MYEPVYGPQRLSRSIKSTQRRYGAARFMYRVHPIAQFPPAIDRQLLTY